MKKSIFLFFAALLFSASAWAGWCGNSFITVNGLWCTGSNSYVHDGGMFHGKDLGTLTTLELGGEFQVWPSSTTAGTLCYKIDDGTENSISLPKTGTDGNNSKHSGSGAVDLSGLAEGSHNIAVWFTHGSDIDNNGGSNYVATFTIAAAGEEPEPVADVTVHFINTPNWAEVACHHWIPNGAGTSWPGDVLSKTDEIAGYDVYTATFTGAHTSCIFNNNNNGSQTGDLIVYDGKYYALSTQTWYDTKADAENALATPLPDETVYFVNNKSWTKVQVYGFEGSKGNADPAWPGTDITTNKTGEKVGEYDVYSFTAKQGEYAKIIFNNKEGDTGEQTNNLVWTNGKYYYMEAPTDYEGGTADEVKTAIDNLVTYDYYIADNGSLSGNADWSSKAIGLTDDNSDGVYEKTFTAQAAGTYLLKVTNGTWNDGYVWDFSAVEGAYEEVNAGESDNNIEITLTTATTFTVKFDSDTKKITFDGLTEKAPEPTFDYYIAGSFNGDNPKKAENGMTLDGTVYKATVTLAAGDNTLKVTDGTWENTWGYAQLGAAYEEVFDAGEYNNIKITLAAEKEITVIFDATAGEITFEGLTPYVTPLTYTVTVPAGTEKCYIAGSMNGWAFQEMEAVTGETNKFTITIVGAKETDEYKYACQADWAYAEVIDGGGNRTAWQELDQVEEWGKPVVVTYQLKGVGGWETEGIELVQNPENDKEYMLTCQAISAADAIKVVRLEDGVIKDYYGNGTVKDAVEVTVNYDGDGNITLPEGTYNFYFDTNEPEKKLWIASATDCETEPTTVTLTYDLTTDAVSNKLGRRYVTAEDATLGNVQIILPSFNTETTEYTDASLGVGDETLDATATYTADTDNNKETYTATATSEDGTTTYNVTMTIIVPATQTYTFLATIGAEATVNEYEWGTEYSINGSGYLDDTPVEFELLADNMGFLSGTINGVDVYCSDATTNTENELGETYLSVMATAQDEVGNTYNIQMWVLIVVEKVEIVITEEIDVTLSNLKLEPMGNMAMVTADNLSFWMTLLETENYYGTYESDMFSNIWYGGDDAIQLQAYGEGIYTSNALTVSFISEPDAEGNATKYNFTLTHKTITLTTGDNSDVIEANIGETVNVKIERSFTANNGYYTLCVPFDMPASVIGKAYQISSITEHAAQGIDVEFTEVANMLAGQPYLIKPNTIDNPIVAAVTISNSTPTAVTVAGEGISITMQGMFNSDGQTNGLYWVGNGGYLYNDNVSTNGLCAYFNISTPSSVAPRMRVVTGENATTGLDQIVAPAGQAVKAIENGQLIIIRDGVKYNVQGQKL